MMRRLPAFLALALLVLVLGAASPALAQRDPFDPQSGGGAAEEEEPSGGNGGDGSAEDPTVQPGDDEDTDTSPNRSEQLANTGSDPEPWLVVAYGLIVAGAAALFVSKVYTPVGQRK